MVPGEMRPRYLCIVTLEEGKIIHNAFLTSVFARRIGDEASLLT